MAIDHKTFEAWVRRGGPIPPQLDAELQLIACAMIARAEVVDGKLRVPPDIGDLEPEIGEALCAVLLRLDRKDAVGVALASPLLWNRIDGAIQRTKRRRPAAKGGLERARKKAGTHKRWTAAARKIHHKHPAWSAWQIAGELSKRRWRNSAGTLGRFTRKTIYERIRPELTDPSK